jgi:hypothetical protein
VVLSDESHKPAQRLVTFLFRQVVDLLHMVPDGEHALPARDGIGPNHRMHRSELCADVFRGAPWSSVDAEVVLGRSLVEERLRVSRRQRFEKSLVWR